MTLFIFCPSLVPSLVNDGAAAAAAAAVACLLHVSGRGMYTP